MLKSLKVGDRVMTSGGIVGTNVEGGEHFVKLDIADRVRVEVGRGYIAGKIATRDGKDVERSRRKGRSPLPSGRGGFLGKLFGK